MYQEINSLFEETGNIVLDYHNTSSTCKNESGVQDGTIDDQKGIINFLRGKVLIISTGYYSDRLYNLSKFAKKTHNTIKSVSKVDWKNLNQIKGK